MAVCNAYNTLFMADSDSRSEVYCYTNRFEGEQLLQNAFFKQQYSKNISSMHTHEEEMYFLTKNAENKYSFYYHKFREDDTNHVWLDDSEVVVAEEGVTTFYDLNTNETILTFSNTVDVDNDTVISGYEDYPVGFAGAVADTGGVIQTIRSIDRSTPGTTLVTLRGRVTDGQTLYFGKNYQMTLQ